MGHCFRAVLTAVALVAAIGLGVAAAQAQSQPAASDADAAASLAVGDYPAATATLRRLADEGDAEAQMMLAGLYLGGHGVDRNIPLAIAWLQQAAYGGNVHAMVRLGTVYKDFGPLLTGGTGFEAWPTAVGWFAMAAAAGSAEGAYQAGTTFATRMVSRNMEWLSREAEETLARQFFEQAAAMGDARAAWRLAMMDREHPEFVDRLRQIASGMDGVHAQAALAHSDRVAEQLAPRERYYWGLVALRNIEMTGNERVLIGRSAEEFALEVDALGTALDDAERSSVEAEVAAFVSDWIDPYP